jgi:hypothetical protein
VGRLFNMIRSTTRWVPAGVAVALIAACGGSGSSVVDQLVAQSIDIGTAKYRGKPSPPDGAGFTLTRLYGMAEDDYTYTLDYLSSATADGMDGGNSIDGYKWWNFAFPTVLMSGEDAIGDFVSAMPSHLPPGVAATGLTDNAFTMNVIGGAGAATVDIDAAQDAATLVYQVDRTKGVVTVSPIDISTSSGLAALTAGLAAGAPVKVYGVPQANGELKAYVLAYFTGQAPAQ